MKTTIWNHPQPQETLKAKRLSGPSANDDKSVQRSLCHTASGNAIDGTPLEHNVSFSMNSEGCHSLNPASPLPGVRPGEACALTPTDECVMQPLGTTAYTGNGQCPPSPEWGHTHGVFTGRSTVPIAMKMNNTYKRTKESQSIWGREASSPTETLCWGPACTKFKKRQH